MNLISLIETIYEDLDARVRSVAVDDTQTLRLHIEYDSIVDPEGAREVDIACLGAKDYNVTPGYFGTIGYSSEHPVLLLHQGPQASLYFFSAPAVPSEVFYKAHEVLTSQFSPWLDPATFLNGSPAEICKYLEGGHGLLAKGPSSAMKLLANAVSPLLNIKLIESHVLEADLSVLVLDNKYVICASADTIAHDA